MTKPYTRYQSAVRKLAPWIEENIKKNPEKRIILRIDDIRDNVPEFKRLSDLSLY